MQQIAIIEDDQEMQELYSQILDQYQTVRSSTAEEGLEVIAQKHPDLVLLDLGLPGTDGFDVCRQCRQNPNSFDIPIIIITGNKSDDDVVKGLELGADDYITKPFNNRELIARVKAVLRRRHNKQESISINGLVIDLERFKVILEGDLLQFTATEFRLLHTLAANPGRVFSRGQLIHRAIADDAVVVERTIDVHIRAIRMKLGAKQCLIETVRGIGYRFQE